MLISGESIRQHTTPGCGGARQRRPMHAKPRNGCAGGRCSAESRVEMELPFSWWQRLGQNIAITSISDVDSEKTFGRKIPLRESFQKLFCTPPCTHPAPTCWLSAVANLITHCREKESRSTPVSPTWNPYRHYHNGGAAGCGEGVSLPRAATQHHSREHTRAHANVFEFASCSEIPAEVWIIHLLALSVTAVV